MITDEAEAVLVLACGGSRSVIRWHLERLTNERVVVDLNPGASRASRNRQRQVLCWPPNWRHWFSSGVVGEFFGRKALGVTSRVRKTGPDMAMVVEDVSIIAALAQRVSGTRTSIASHQIRALSLADNAGAISWQQEYLATRWGSLLRGWAGLSDQPVTFT
jgi:hypothetical protein